MAASSTISSRRSVASSSASVKRRDSHPLADSDISIDALVNHLLASKRSLSCVSHVLRATELAMAAHTSHEESIILAARTAFLRGSIADMIVVLAQVRRGLNSICDWGKRDFKKLTATLDDTEKQLTTTMDMLRATELKQQLRPSEEECRNLFDFVDETSVHELRQALKLSVEELQAVNQSLEDDLFRFDADVQSLQRTVDALPILSTDKDPTSIQSSMVELLLSLEEHSSSMAQLLASLTKHFDMCVTAIRTTEGAAALARRRAAEVSQSQSGDGVSISGVIAEQESLMSELEPKTAEDRAEMLKVVLQDADEVDGVVREIQQRLTSMQQEFGTMEEHAQATKAAHLAAREAYTATAEVGSRLTDYLAAGEEFRARWNFEKSLLLGKLEEMRVMRDFYEGYASAYDSLVLEVERRHAVEKQVEALWRKAQAKVDKLLDADRAAREAFRQDVGEFLPQDLWSGVQGPARTWKVVQQEEEEEASAEEVIAKAQHQESG